VSRSLPGNPHYGSAKRYLDLGPDAEQAAQTEATLALAYEQRTATLVALLAIRRAPVGFVWHDWEANIQAQITERLGLGVPDA
jgi:hypothetical protein